MIPGLWKWWKTLKKQEELFCITALADIKYNFPVISYAAIYYVDILIGFPVDSNLF